MEDWLKVLVAALELASRVWWILHWLVKNVELFPLVELLTSTFLTAMVVYIAWQQYETNRARLESERRDRDWQRQYSMFDRRWEVYTGVRKYLDDVMGESNPETILRAVVDLQQLQWAADVLFESRVNRYLMKLRDHGLKLCEWREKRSAEVDGESSAAAKARHGEAGELAWFRQQYDAIVGVFAEELRLSGKPASQASQASQPADVRTDGSVRP